jgi:hypothetical protein
MTLAALAARGIRPTAVTRDRRRLSDLELDLAIVEGDIGAPDPAFIAEVARHDILLHLAWDGLPNYKSLHHFRDRASGAISFPEGGRGGRIALDRRHRNML